MAQTYDEHKAIIDAAMPTPALVWHLHGTVVEVQVNGETYYGYRGNNQLYTGGNDVTLHWGA